MYIEYCNTGICKYETIDGFCDLPPDINKWPIDSYCSNYPVPISRTPEGVVPIKYYKKEVMVKIYGFK
jgi:hypothetical protein